MFGTSLKEVAAIVSGFRLPRAPLVMIHSSLLPLGVVEGGAAGLYTCLRETLGPDATIVMPTFTLSFGRSRRWSYHGSRSETGALTEHLRLHEGVVRTVHPFHSVCIDGPLRDVFGSCNATSSFGDGSPFAVLHDADAWNLSIGTEFASTYLHHTEETLQVPYRYYKPFPGEVLGRDGTQDPREFRMYARLITDTYEFENVWERAWDALSSCFRVRTLDRGGGKFMLSRIREGHAALARLLQRNPFAIARRIDKPEEM